MHLLLNDQLKGPRPIFGAVVSAGMHVAVFAGLVLGGRHVVDGLADAVEQSVRYLIPEDRAASAAEPRVEYTAPVSGAVSGVGVALGSGGSLLIAKPAPPAKAATGDSDLSQRVVPEPTAAENAYSILDVDSAAVRDPASAAPIYPPLMVEKEIEGSALIRFVVDSTGYVDFATVQIIRATNPLFSKAVTDAMPGMRFRPAMAGNQPVRQLVEQEFRFRLERAAAKPTAAAAKKP